ncbi:aminoglycoside phosphotransferase family protein [Streptomyces sp. NPDC090025]|uniref:aminoglycoside phosphotransferase family protein n=1 Tax=Streptomyces sp. NPDC090025 TaxID=3365922 RepID=UPI003835655E
MDALALYEKARADEGALAGFYHQNVRVDTDTGPVLVRTAGPGNEAMDLTLWPEPAVLEAIRGHVSRAPRLLHVQSDPPFQIHEFIEGRLVHDLAPDAGSPVPDGVVEGVERLFAELLRIPSEALPPTPADWPADGDTVAFALLLLDGVREIRGRAAGVLEGLYSDLGVPADPCSELAGRAVHELTPRPFRLLHGDIHRQNMILDQGGEVVFLDWELALWGDPVYDLADHLHKTGYPAADRERVEAGWERVAPADCRSGLEAAAAYYRDYEQMKSAVVDTVRWGRRISQAPATGEERLRLAVELRDKLRLGGRHWGGGEPPEAEEIVATALRRLGTA